MLPETRRGQKKGRGSQKEKRGRGQNETAEGRGDEEAETGRAEEEGGGDEVSENLLVLVPVRWFLTELCLLNI